MLKFDILAKPVGTAVSKVASHASSPSVLVGVGIGLMVLGGAAACKATLEAVDILEAANGDLGKIDDASQKAPDVYTEDRQLKDKVTVFTKTVVGMARIYAPAGLLAAGGIGSILCGHNLINGRYFGMVAAYKTLDTGYKAYRGAVVKELGEDADRRFRYGIEKKQLDIPKFDKEGNETGKTVKKTVDVRPDPDRYSEYARYFDASCSEWTKNPEYNKLFLRSQEAAANDILQTRGHIFLNEVYDMLGFERTEAGTAVGWKLGNGDDFVDFGMFDIYNEAGRNFVNGIEPVILLDFNVDGPIYDKI